MNTNPYPIYVINLKRNPERKLHIQRQLDALNLSYKFVDAIDKYDMQSPTYRCEIACQLGIDGGGAIKSNASAYYYSRLACALSHVKAYNLMIENNDQAACILEDDSIISLDFLEILRAAQKIPWDILMLSSQSKTIRYMLGPYFNVQGNVEIFSRLRRIKWFRRLLPYTVIPQVQLDRISKYKLKWCLLMLLSYSKTLNKIMYKFFLRSSRPLLKFSKIDRRILHERKGIYSYGGCQLGALPIRSSQQTLYGNYDIATPIEEPTSSMGYLLTLSMAYKWKKLVRPTAFRPIDSIPWNLHEKYGIRLRIVTPPCVTASLSYIENSALRM